MKYMALLVLVFSMNVATAAVINKDTNGYVTSIDNLSIGSGFFDVTFHLGVNGTFNSLFNPNVDNNLDTTPYYWGNQTGAN